VYGGKRKKGARPGNKIGKKKKLDTTRTGGGPRPHNFGGGGEAEDGQVDWSGVTGRSDERGVSTGHEGKKATSKPTPEISILEDGIRRSF